MKNKLALTLASLIIITATNVLACPTISGLIDYNCDRKIRIGILGDSFVAGKGDLGKGSNKGYVKRLSVLPEFKDAQVLGIGLSGYSSFEIRIEVQRSLQLSRPNRLKRNLTDLDLLIIDLGRNDFFVDLAPADTVKNLKIITKVLTRTLGRGARLAPLFAIAKLPGTSPQTRPIQNQFISTVDSLLIRGNSARLPVRIPFDELQPLQLSKDGLHPSPMGYETLTEIATTYILREAQEESFRKRPDSDGDGVYDAAESKLFRTDPNNPDSDGDSFSDGDELFLYGTDPLSAR